MEVVKWKESLISEYDGQKVTDCYPWYVSDKFKYQLTPSFWLDHGNWRSIGPRLQKRALFKIKKPWKIYIKINSTLIVHIF